jgi:hypothetical protein
MELVGNAEGSMLPAHLSPQLHPAIHDMDALRAETEQIKAQNAPLAEPLLGPPGPPKGQDQQWTPVPTRQNYEDKPENQRQRRYMTKYGTLYP